MYIYLLCCGFSGSYLFVDGKYGGGYYGLDSYEAVILSQRLSSDMNGSWCFAFSYRLLVEGNETAQLNVDQTTLTTGRSHPLFSTSDPTAGLWFNVQLEIKPFGTESDFLLSVKGTVSFDKQMTSRIGKKCSLNIYHFL